MKVHMLASEPHYERHVRAVWEKLPEELRGEARTGRAATPRSLPGRDWVMVGAHIDIDRVQNHRIIYVEHGAGQSYVDIGRHAEAYAHKNSQHPQRVLAYISPRREIADGWGRAAFAAGCPALENVERSYAKQAAITFHWDAYQICPEATSARPWWLPHLHEVITWLREYEYDVVGHAHPRDRDAAGVWKALEIDFEPDVDAVLSNCSLLIADNTSVMYEAAAIGIPVLALNAPWYRRDVHHGLRFWDAIPGLCFDSPDEMFRLDLGLYPDSDVDLALRAKAFDAAYDGIEPKGSGERAAQWVTNLLTKK